MEALIARPQYLDDLISLRGKDVIKVVTGIRRCGKSTLFELYINHLLNEGVSERNIVHVNLEYPEYGYLESHMDLYDYIKSLLQEDGMNYIFIDEVQVIPEFQKAIAGLFARKNCDVHITGSNASILSGELATLLSGRYIEIKMLPLSFKEYVSAFDDASDLPLKYQNYLRRSSFPYALQFEKEKDIRAYLAGIFDSVLLKDIVMRKSIKDVANLKRVTSFLFDNIASITSSTKIANTLSSSGRKTSVHTVESYINALTTAFVMYKATRFDIKGRQHLATGAKYYLVDIGLRYYLLGDRNADRGHMLENVVYLELLRRGFKVSVGKMGTTEVDFVAQGPHGPEYYQVAYSLQGDDLKEGMSVIDRELRSLDAIKDNYPKYLLTMDYGLPETHNGIQQRYVLDWLLDK